ncbi:pantoate--beta-alanine ligase [Flavobacteriaceae bacterium]|nr:pantoate--beta-alanine ligase [Flavobacteriaceae bacterium]MDA9882763.1 pantoate--beta-alanine ligase [Flavobacteriaceae bacterium]MDC3219316.1 pantoate--beta-alanine ligase [Flavobacteriaceae bacterium]
MRVYTSHKELLKSIKHKLSLGLVPTMGSLHEGHLSLIEKAYSENDEVIVSIYVNPTQFNDKEDLKKYPRNIKEDLRKLNRFENIIVYTPENNDLYQKNESSKQYDFGSFTNLMEGKHRPGHFDGVATIIEKLFKIFNPDNAYFGEKDFQQLLLIKTLTEQLDIKTNVVGCETIREADGLAMSSRNKLMSDKERKSAKEIIKLLLWAKEVYSKFDFIQIKDEIENRSKLIDSFKLEYFEIMNLEEFSSISKKNNETRAFMACRIGNIRLIDNIKL